MTTELDAGLVEKPAIPGLDAHNPQNQSLLNTLTDPRRQLMSSPFSSAALGFLDRTSPEELATIDTSAWSVLGAAFRRENTVGSALSNQTVEASLYPTAEKELTSDEIWERLKKDNLIHRSDSFTSIRTESEYEGMKAQLTREDEDRAILEASGWGGFAASMLAGAVDLPSLLPVGAGAAFARSGLRAAGAAAFGAGTQATASELLLQGTQETRTAEETALNIGGSMVLGGALGFAAHTVVGRRLARDIEKRIEADIADDLKGSPNKASAGAAAVDHFRDQSGLSTIIDRTNASGQDAILKYTSKALGSAEFVFENPIIKLMDSKSKVARDHVGRLITNPWLRKRNVGPDGVAEEVSADALAQMYQGRAAEFIATGQANSKAAKKAGEFKQDEDFARAVYYAVITGDDGGSVYVRNAADTYTKQVVTPIKEAAIKYGLLPDDIDTKTAIGYVPRLYNRDVLRAKEARFLNLAEDWAYGRVKQDAADEIAAGTRKRVKSEKVLRKEASQIAQDMYENLLDINRIGSDLSLPVGITKVWKGRVFTIDDRILADEGFLETNIFTLAERFARTAGTDVALAEKFHKTRRRRVRGEDGEFVKDDKDKFVMETVVEPDIQMKQVVDDIKKEFSEPIGSAKGEAKRKLIEERDEIIRTMQGLRDVLRGVYDVGDYSTGSNRFRTMANVTLHLNLLRLLGGMTISAGADPINIVAANGLKNTFKFGVIPAIRNFATEFRQMPEPLKRAARIAGANMELENNARIAKLLTEDDLHSHKVTNAEKWLENASRKFGKLTLMTYWNDYFKQVTYNTAQARVITDVVDTDFGKLSKDRQAHLRLLGIGKDEADQIKKAYEAQTEKEFGGIPFADHDNWPTEIGNIFRAAMNNDVRATIVTPGVGDKPLISHTVEGKLAFQFKSFMFAMSARFMGRQMQLANVSDELGKKANVYGGVMALVAANVFIDGIKRALYLNSADFDEWLERAESTPGAVLYDSIDRSGTFGLVTEINNVLFSPGPMSNFGLRAGLQYAFGDTDGSSVPSRYRGRPVSDMFLGPTAGLLEDTARTVGSAVGAIATEDGRFTRGDVTKGKRLIPGQNLFYLRPILDWGQEEIGTAFDLPITRANPR